MENTCTGRRAERETKKGSFVRRNTLHGMIDDMIQHAREVECFSLEKVALEKTQQQGPSSAYSKLIGREKPPRALIG